MEERCTIPKNGHFELSMWFNNIYRLMWIDKIALLRLFLVTFAMDTIYVSKMTAAITALPSSPFEAAVVDGAWAFSNYKVYTLTAFKPIIVIAVLFNKSTRFFKTYDIILYPYCRN
ncbi:MAG: hypothetical protein U5N58_05070 [Actinomycetota bacterium]|nr:hypothetical protein [Actinomycetota bacterium]